MKQSKWLVISGAALLATAIACGTTPTPTSPASSAAVSAAAGASGETLKIGAPTLTSPTGNIQLTTSTVVLTYSAVSGTYGTFAPSYQIELRDLAGTLIANPTVTTTSYTVTASLTLDTGYTWRVRATYQGAFGPWSTTATFRTQVAAYISGNTLYDPLTLGTTVGTAIGPVSFVKGVGLKLEDQTSSLRYTLPTTLEAGEFSVMILGADEGSAGGKSKVFSMQEGTDGITDNDYRATIELRARDYPTPGAVTCRIITGDAGNIGQIFDCPRIVNSFSSSHWYFWRFAWGNGRATLTVRQDNETGPVIYDVSMGIGSHAYRPVPHVLYLGAPVGRAGPTDATIGGGPIYKNVWVGPTARPTFPASLSKALLSGPGGN
jgi:hypothetical protein